MRKELTDITVVLDRSGSMAAIQEDAEGGLNAFIEKQKGEPGEANFSLVQFDTDYEFVHRCVPIKDVPRCRLHPRGSTALWDAVGQSINDTGRRLAAMSEDQRPGLVVFVIVTDGQENASREFCAPQIKEMIERQTKDYSWQFTYLGANQDSFTTAGGLGIQRRATANYSPSNSPQMFMAAASNVARMRSSTARGVKADNSYTDDEQRAMN